MAGRQGLLRRSLPAVAPRHCLAVVGVSLAAAVLGSCSVYGAPYGAAFGYPNEPPIPPGATIIASDTGQDDDDPIRSQIQVIDAQRSTAGELLAFYRAPYPESACWETVNPESWQELRLVNRASDGYTQVLDVSDYGGS